MEAAQALGKHLMHYEGSPEQRINQAFIRCFSRPATNNEITAVLDFYQKQVQRFTAAPESAKALAVGEPSETSISCAAWTLVGRALMNMDEFVTKR